MKRSKKKTIDWSWILSPFGIKRPVSTKGTRRSYHKKKETSKHKWVM